MKLKPGYVEITSEIRDKILFEIKRTGIAPQRRLKGHKEAKEIGLTSGIVYRFVGMNGAAKTGKREHVEMALSLWNDVPNKQDQSAKKQLSSYQKAREIHRDGLLKDHQ